MGRSWSGILDEKGVDNGMRTEFGKTQDMFKNQCAKRMVKVRNTAGEKQLLLTQVLRKIKCFFWFQKFSSTGTTRALWFF
jgi:hypothetical protein